MAASQYDQFLQEATTRDPEADRALWRNRLYGLYSRRCFLAQAAPRSEDAFWAAMKIKRIHSQRTSLRMRGPAAVDYMLASYAGLV
ncbi:hypothetical protein [Arthrobacter sp. UYEF20]|uniref:hypothetical protein n=1 Tax=Arthrobacter sp. UYEF20 TaxID=1756363 RepID=UPI003391C3E8